MFEFLDHFFGMEEADLLEDMIDQHDMGFTEVGSCNPFEDVWAYDTGSYYPDECFEDYDVDEYYDIIEIDDVF